jgi:hypothetical protein
LLVATAVGPAGPEREQRGTLENEPRGVGGLRQSIEQPLVRVTDQHELEFLAAFAREAQQAGAYRRGHVPGDVRHASASR